MDLSFIDKANGPSLVIGLEELAAQLNFTISDLKKQLGIRESTLNRWLNLKRSPRRSSWMKIKSYLNSMLERCHIS